MSCLRAICGLLLLLSGALAWATEAYVDEDFSTWPGVHLTSEGTHHQNNWRFFTVGGALGELKCIPYADGRYLRLGRGAAAGDTGLDLDQPDQTLILPPSTHIYVRVWARRHGAAATLDVRVAEYQGTQWLNIDNPHAYELSDTFTPYAFHVTTSAQTNRVDVALRVGVGQQLEVSRIEVVPVESATTRAPRIMLPQGWTPNERPTLWWQAPGHGQVQVQLAESMAFAALLWDSGQVASASNHMTLPAQTPGRRVFARLRVQDLHGGWSAWSDPTLIFYNPLPQLPAQELFVYETSAMYALSDAQCYEQGLLAAVLQGLANRERPRLYFIGAAHGQEWLEKLAQPGRWLEHVTLVKNSGAKALYASVQTSEGSALRITRSNTVGDTGVDLGLQKLALPVTSGTTIQVTCRARAISPSAQLGLRVAEYDADFNFQGNDNYHPYTLTSAFQDYSFSFTVGTHTSLINPALRSVTVGSLEVRSLRLTVTGQPGALLDEDFETWTTGQQWQTPGTWSDVCGWRIFGTGTPDIMELVNRFSDAYEGVVLWDPAVPATSNVAATIAGVENLLPVPLRDEAGSLYRMLVTGGPHLPVKRSLVGKFTGAGTIPDIGEASSGSAKNDAYRWAEKQYLRAGLTDPQRFGFYVDAFAGPHHSNLNIDFFVMKKGFLWDLSVWDDEKPIDDPAQPLGTDVATLKRIFGTAAQLAPNRIIQCGGFPPFTIKYSNYAEPPANAGGTHEPVPTEWKCVEILSSYNVELEADGVIPNCSVFTHMPRPERVNQVPPPLIEDCRDAGWLTTGDAVANRTFILHYVGDYDSPCWLNTLLPPFWDNGLRGKVLMSWAWDPNMCERGMPQFDEYMRTRTAKDVLWSGDSGAGYTNPNQFLAPRAISGLPDAGQAWKEHCAYWFRMFDMRQVGYIISGNTEPTTDQTRALYESFAGDGVVDGWTTDQKMIGTMPVIKMKHNELPKDTTAAAAQSAAQATAGTPSFVALRSILRDPEYYYQLNRNLQVDYAALNPAFVTPSEFFYLLRHQLGGQNHYRAAFLGDTVTSGTLFGGRKSTRKLWLRNLGWKTWPASGANAVRVGVELATADARQNPLLLNLPAAVAPGQMVELTFDLDLPAAPQALRYWRIDLREGDATWFGDHGNLPESRLVQLGPLASQSNHWELLQ